MILVRPDSGSHWYRPDGAPMHDMACANGAGTRPTSLRDARKLGLYPSVTNVLSILAKPGPDAWKQEQAVPAALTLPRRSGESEDEFARRVTSSLGGQGRDAADLGSAIHRGIERYAKTRELPKNPDVARLFEPVRQWFDAEVTQVHGVEVAVAHPEWGYAGRVDLVATLQSSGRPTVIDFKTQTTRRDRKGNFTPGFHEVWPLQLEAYRQALVSTDPKLSEAETASVVIGSTEPVPVVVRVWDPLEAPARFRAFLAARHLWVFTRRYCPVTHSPESARTLSTPPVTATS